MARPSLYTPELAELICERVVCRSLNAVCQDEDMPSRETVYAWLHKHQEFLDSYTRARKTRSYARAERLDDVLDSLRSGAIDAASARVEMDGIKWQTAKENAPVFGERMAIDHGIQDDMADKIKAARERAGIR